MSDTQWIELMATPSHEAGIEWVRQLWLETDRVDAALSVRRLADVALLLAKDKTAGAVHVVTSRLSASAPCDRDAIPPHWYVTEVAESPAPEFALFYERGSAFPCAAVVFTGEAGRHGWLTYHKRPLILQRLRERFQQLTRLSGHQPALSVVRERAVAANGDPSGVTTSSAEAPWVRPEQLYRSILAAHFATEAPTDCQKIRPEHAPSLAAHQERAYERACDTLDRFGGVIIADAVGLGKTYIGLRLLEDTLQDGGEGLLVVPAALRDQWIREISYLQPYSAGIDDARARAESVRGDNLDLWIREAGLGRVGVVSIESLSRRAFNRASLAGADIVIVDEAHNFRNAQTQRYRNLADLVRHSRVVLLTATPINNTLFDLQHLIELFAAPGAFRHLGINDFRALFQRAAAGDGDVSDIVSACVLRRTRRFLRACYGEVVVDQRGTDKPLTLRFPRCRPAVAIEYDLARTYRDVFSRLDEWFGALNFPSTLSSAEDDRSESGHASVAGLLKVIMLKRLESSVEAFRRTVSQQLAWCRTALNALSAGRILGRPEYRAAFRGPADDPGSQLALFELVLPVPVTDQRRMTDLRREVENDAGVLSRIHTAVRSIGIEEDRKITALIDLLNGRLSGRKVLIFTEFRDTARYIHAALGHRPYVARIDSSSARLGREPAGRRDVIERFAPQSNGVLEPPARERVEILIATDVLSEGLNLQDASTVVSYDLPWNPVRLMQRIGRIDRLGAIHDSVELYHFVPTRELERLLRLMSRLHDKVKIIETTLGAEDPVLGPPGRSDGGLQHLRILASSPDGYERVEEDLEGPFDPEEQAYLDCIALIEGEPIAASAPCVSAVVAGRTDRVRAIGYWRITCGRQSRGLWLVCDPRSGCVVEDTATAVEELRTALTRSIPEPTNGLESSVGSARRACARHVETVMARLEAARIAGDALLPRLPQCRIASWLSQALQSKGFHPSPEVRDLADRLLEKLARRFTAAGERSLSQIAGRLPSAPTPSFLSDLEQQLLELAPHESRPATAREIGLLLLLPRS